MKLREMPYPYRHPNKPSDDAVDESSVDTFVREPALRTIEPTQPKTSPKPTIDGPSPLFDGKPSPTDATVVRVGIPVPILRTTPLFARLVADDVPERVVALRLGQRAVDWWLADQSIDLDVPSTHRLAPRSVTIETTRVMAAATFGSIERRFDPHDIHSARMRGRLFGHAVLERWIEAGHAT